MHGNVNVDDRKRKIQEKMSKIRHKIVVMSGKGGVGKSTMSVNLAYGLSLRGFKVGILDADLHGPNVPLMLGREGIKLPSISAPLEVTGRLSVSSLSFFIPDNDPVIWRGPQKMGAIMEMLEGIDWGEIDFLVVDLPPGTGDETLTVAQNIGPEAKSIIVTTPQDVSLLDSKRAVKFSRLLNLKLLGIVENMSGFICPDCGKEMNIFKKGGAEKMAKDTNSIFLGSIPVDASVVEAGDTGLPYVSTDSRAARKMNDIITNILEQLEML